MPSSVTWVGSYVTIAWALLKLTSAFSTPSSPSRARLPNNGQANHVIPSIRRVTSWSASPCFFPGKVEAVSGALLPWPSHPIANTRTNSKATKALRVVRRSIYPPIINDHSASGNITNPTSTASINDATMSRVRLSLEPAIRQPRVSHRRFSRKYR